MLHRAKRQSGSANGAPNGAAGIGTNGHFGRDAKSMAIASEGSALLQNRGEVGAISQDGPAKVF